MAGTLGLAISVLRYVVFWLSLIGIASSSGHLLCSTVGLNVHFDREANESGGGARYRNDHQFTVALFYRLGIRLSL